MESVDRGIPGRSERAGLVIDQQHMDLQSLHSLDLSASHTPGPGAIAQPHFPAAFLKQ